MAERIEIIITRADDGRMEVEYVIPGLPREYLQVPKGGLAEALAIIATEVESEDCIVCGEPMDELDQVEYKTGVLAHEQCGHDAGLTPA